MATILVVDDEKNYLCVLQELFESEGYDVLTCDKAADALALLRQEPVDLLLTDLRMAEMDGMALLPKVRDCAPAVPTIVMTAYGTVEQAVEAMRLGAYDFVQKPFSNADLLRTVARALERTTRRNAGAGDAGPRASRASGRPSARAGLGRESGGVKRTAGGISAMPRLQGKKSLRLRLFEEIENFEGEPFVTRVLACLLKLPPVRVALWKSAPELKRMGDPRDDVRIIPEPGGEGGRPDIRLCNHQIDIWLELKFRAPLTPAQRNGYPNRKRARVLFLVPKERKEAIKRECPGRQIVVIAWETFLDALHATKTTDKLLINEFIGDIRRRLKMGEPFNKEELKILKKPEAAHAYSKIEEFAKEFYEQLENLKKSIPSLHDVEKDDSDPDNQLGRNIYFTRDREKDTWAWIGTCHWYWREYGDGPFWIAVRPKDEQHAKTVQKIMKRGHWSEEKDGRWWIHPLTPGKSDDGSLKGQAIKMVQVQVENLLNQLLRGLSRP